MVTRLIQGHSEFRQGFFHHERELFEVLAKGAQAPLALMISCCDARVVPDLITSAEPGDLFVVRNIANIVPRFDKENRNQSVGAAIEYAVHVLKVPHIVICGHTGCGGIQAIAEGPEKLADEMPTLANWLHAARSLHDRLTSVGHGRTTEDLARQLVFENVVVQLENLLTYPVVTRALDEDRLELHGWVYDLADASLRVYHPETNSFFPAEVPPLNH
ncbi:carbonic anhydrase [Myxococcaceae bacterium GXIMD 01537]